MSVKLNKLAKAILVHVDAADALERVDPCQPKWRWALAKAKQLRSQAQVELQPAFLSKHFPQREAP